MFMQETVVEKILAHFNHRMSEAELVRWAEDVLVQVAKRYGYSNSRRTDLSWGRRYARISAVLVGALGFSGALETSRPEELEDQVIFLPLK